MSEWYYSKNNQQQGPVSSEQLKQLAASGQLQPNDLVWKEGMAQWTVASSITGLFASPVTRPSPTSPPSVPGSLPKLPPVLYSWPAVLALLTFCFPFGHYLVWTHPIWSRRQKIIWSGVWLALVVIGLANRESSHDGRITHAETAVGLTPPTTSSSSTSQQGQQPRDTDVVPQNKSSGEWKTLGTLQKMGQTFYDDLPFANVAKGEQVDGVPFAEDFCPNGEAKYRRIEYGNNWTNEWAISAGLKVEDKVSEGSQAMNYFVTADEPRCICRSNNQGQEPLPRIRIGAKPGDKWKYEWPQHPMGEQLYSVFSYVRAVRFRGFECALIVDEERESLPGRDILVQRFERWYAKGVGLIQEDRYAAPVLGTTGKPPELLFSIYRMGK